MTRGQGTLIMKGMIVMLAVMLGIILMLLAKPAHALSACGRYTDMRENLINRFHEHSVGIGESAGVIIEMFEAEKGATFTMLVINMDGKACIFAAGSNWQVPKMKDGTPL